MTIEKASRSEALLKLYYCLNGPHKSGTMWVTYNRSQIDASLFVLKQLLELEGYEFREIE